MSQNLHVSLELEIWEKGGEASLNKSVGTSPGFSPVHSTVTLVPTTLEAKPTSTAFIIIN